MSVERLLENLERLAHFEHAHHVAVVNIAVFAQRHAEIEAAIDAVVVHFANVVIDAGGAQHRARWPPALMASSRGSTPTPWVRAIRISLPVEQLLELVEKAGKGGDDRGERLQASPRNSRRGTPPNRM